MLGTHLFWPSPPGDPAEGPGVNIKTSLTRQPQHLDHAQHEICSLEISEAKKKKKEDGVLT